MGYDPLGVTSGPARRFADCIYCGATATSREHPFPAGLGGRRRARGISCGPCNERFSPVEARLIADLAPINGLIGVRSDHRRHRAKARLEHPVEGSLLLDRFGNLEFAEPRILSETRADNGSVVQHVCFSNQAQEDRYVAEARKRGITVARGPAERVRRYMLDGAPMRLAFGGPESFRAVARIALNFLAFSMPAVARSPVLDPLKDFIRFGRGHEAGLPRHVWYADRESSLPPAATPLLHQVFLCARAGVVFARVRFFSIFELVVWFGDVPDAVDQVVLHEIDPLAERPLDLRTRVLEPDHACAPARRPEYDAPLPGPVRFGRLFDSIRDQQWRIASVPTLARLEFARSEAGWRRRDLVHQALADHSGRMLHLARAVLARVRHQLPDAAGADVISEGLGEMVAVATEEPSGVTFLTGVVLALVHDALADAVTAEITHGPMTSDALRELLQGERGARIIARVLLEPVCAALEHHLLHRRASPDT